MIKKITKQVVKEVTEVVSEVIVCDVCSKELNYNILIGTSKVASYYEITTGHRDWGNDSWESRKNRQVCCDECLSRFTQEWLKDPDVIGSNTAYIEIEKDRHWLTENKEPKDN